MIEAIKPFWPVITLILGAGLTLTVQYFLENIKQSKSLDNKKRELISKGRAKIYLIAQLLKDLAMYKTHKQYYLQAYKSNIDKEDSYKKHYEKGQEQRATETKLDLLIAEYFEIVSEFYILSKKNDSFKELYEPIFHYEHPKSKTFTSSTEDTLVNELKEEEARLNQVYKETFFTKINSTQDRLT